MFSEKTLRLFNQLLSQTPLQNMDVTNEQFDSDLGDVLQARKELRAALAEAGISTVPEEPESPTPSRQVKRAQARRKATAPTNGKSV